MIHLQFSCNIIKDLFFRNKEGKFKKKLPKTDIPSAKKKSIVKRRSDEAKNDNAEKQKSSEKKKVGHKKAENKPTVSRQLKMDKFITKTKTGKSGSRADASSLGRRSTTMSKNYRSFLSKNRFFSSFFW